MSHNLGFIIVWLETTILLDSHYLNLWNTREVALCNSWTSISFYKMSFYAKQLEKFTWGMNIIEYGKY